jgi:hypothetical protein
MAPWKMAATYTILPFSGILNLEKIPRFQNASIQGLDVSTDGYPAGMFLINDDT